MIIVSRDDKLMLHRGFFQTIGALFDFYLFLIKAALCNTPGIRINGMRIAISVQKIQ
jgi:hypothetical protein